jgi:hypothetical protein
MKRTEKKLFILPLREIYKNEKDCFMLVVGISFGFFENFFGGFGNFL